MNTYDIMLLTYKNDTTLDQVLCTLDDAVNQTCPPKKVNVVINVDTIQDKHIVHLMDDIVKDRCEWTVDFLFEQFADKSGERKRLDRLQTIDFIAQKSKATYYCVFNSGVRIPNDLLAKINQLDRFVLIEPDAEGNGLVVHRNLHDMMFGNEPTVLERYNEKEVLVGDDIVEKTKFLAKKNDQEYLVKRIEDICLIPCLA